MQEHTVDTIRKIRQLLKALAEMAHDANNVSDLHFIKKKTAKQSVQSRRHKLYLAGMINYYHLFLCTQQCWLALTQEGIPAFKQAHAL